MTTPAAERCLWVDAVPGPPSAARDPLPDRVDVAVIGGGYTGVAAARALAGHGVKVAVLERDTLGSGASTRNGGFVLPGYKVDPVVLARRLGMTGARALFDLSLAAVRYLEAIVAKEGIPCDYARSGHVTLAARPAHLRSLAATHHFLRQELGYDTVLLGPGELRDEIGSARYHGGLLDRNAGALHPAKYFHGLAAAARRAGARLLEAVEVLRFERASAGCELLTSRGPLHAGEVLIATNGYGGSLHPGLRRRVVPVGSYMIATAPLGAELSRRLIPRGRMLSDTKHLLFYFRLSGDGRMVFGGRASFTPATTRQSAAILTRGMREVYPELAGVPVEYAWAGKVAMTVDQLPHAGRLDGVHYALGYCGHGVAMATYLGARMGDALAGKCDIPPLPSDGFRTVPLYDGRPWFLPFVGAYYRMLDWVA